jgi:hypothetical protein
MAPSGVIADYSLSKAELYRMGRLETVIDQLNESANRAASTSLLATSHEARLYNADLARELRDIISALKNELDRREGGVVADHPFAPAHVPLI